jgi:TPP-dependent pyruvate/acetoin dehydrogenase alpha subunit
MSPDLWSLYRQMLRSRLFEEAVARLWYDGAISGEMHQGTGEEAVVVGVVSQLEDGDAMALDHRGTAPLAMRGVDLVSLLREFLGQPDGLCGGMGGHMHLFSPVHLAASSGIVGAEGPAVVGFALAARRLRPGKLAVAFFGEGAMNQGMLLEALNLAVAWNLPAIFVCKDTDWAITTRSQSVTGGDLTKRARGFGLQAVDVDGTDVEAVWGAARGAMQRARQGEGPTFLHARCVHLDGHFLDDPLLAIARHPVREMVPMVWPLAKAFLSPKGAPIKERAASLWSILSSIRRAGEDLGEARQRDPLVRARQKLTSDPDRLQALEDEVALDIQQAVESATGRRVG